MYWRILNTWLTGLKNFFKKGIITKLMDSTSDQKDLVKSAKIKRRVTKFELRMRPFQLIISKVVIYDDFKDIYFKNDDVNVILNKDSKYKVRPKNSKKDQ